MAGAGGGVGLALFLSAVGDGWNFPPCHGGFQRKQNSPGAEEFSSRLSAGSDYVLVPHMVSAAYTL